MTHLTDPKPNQWVETLDARNGRKLVVELGPHELTIREKGRHYTYQVPYSAIYDLGAKIVARESLKDGRKGRR